MKYCLFGGDGRSVRLAALLRADGHAVRVFGLDPALPGCADTAAAAAAGADCVILPLPAERDGALNAPFAAAPLTAADVLGPVRAGTPVLAGQAGARLRALCAARGLPLRDYFLREDFTQQNAALTAASAAALLAARRPLPGARVLITGFGRIGSRLAALLTGSGAAVTVAARAAAARAEAARMGCRAVPIAGAATPDYDFAVNTVPARIFGAAELAALGGAQCVELASAPYGFDLDAARALGREVTVAAGLPGRFAPDAAAAALRDACYASLKELESELAAQRRNGD